MRTFENKPLSEKDMKELETLLESMKCTVIENDTTKEKLCVMSNKKDG